MDVTVPSPPVLQYGKCIDVGETVFRCGECGACGACCGSSHVAVCACSSKWNQNIADMAGELAIYAEKAVAILEGGTSGPLNAIWSTVDGALKQVAVSSSGVVWGVFSNDHIYAKSSPTAAWTAVSGSLKQVAVGGDHVWGVTSSDAIYYRSIGDGTCTGSTYNLDLIQNRIAID